MIVATEISANHFVVETCDPVTGKRQRVEVPSAGAAMRIAQEWNRLYIQEKMIGWLNQRIFALNLTHFTRERLRAIELLGILERYSRHPERQLKKLIAEKEQIIALIAPPVKSRQRGYYERVIVLIVQFCKEMEAAK